MAKLVSILILLMAVPIYAAIYSQVDQNGVLHFSDQKNAHAILINLNHQNIAIHPITDARTSNPSPNNINEITITSPTDQATIHDNEGKITIIMTTPTVSINNKIVLLLDGKIIAETCKNTVSLPNIDRGTHTLQAQWFARNQLVSSSKIITFFMRRTIYTARTSRFELPQLRSH